MKVIANIPEKMVQELKDGCFGAKHTLYDLAGAICDGVVLPDNATNGDVIKALFPDSEIKKRTVKTNSCGDIDIGYDVFLYIQKPQKQGEFGFGIKVFFDKSWWNAPYKGGKEE